MRIFFMIFPVKSATGAESKHGVLTLSLLGTFKN